MKLFELRVSNSGASGENRPKNAATRLRPFVFFIGALAVALPAAAIAVKPTYQVFTLKSGKSTDAQMTVTNDGKDTITYKPLVKDWFPTPGYEKIKAEDWIKIDKTPFTLKPGESKLFKYTITAPKKVKGEIDGAVSFSSKPPGAMVEMQMTLVQYLAIAGTERPEAKIPGLSVKVSSDTSIGLLLQNPGNVHLRPKGWIYVDSDAGQRLLNVEINNGQPVFPGTERVYSGTVKGFRLQPGSYTARIELSDMDRPFDLPRITKKFKLTEDGKIVNR